MSSRKIRHKKAEPRCFSIRPTMLLTRSRLEAALVLVYVSWLVSCLATSVGVGIFTWAALLTLVLGVFARSFVFHTDHQQLAFVPLSHYRPLCDDGLTHGTLLVPLVIGATWASIPADKYYSPYTVYLKYTFDLSLTFGVMLVLHAALSNSRRRTWINWVLVIVAQPLIIFIWHFLHNFPLGSFVHTNICVASFQILFHVFLLGFPKSFSPGEAAVVSQFLTLLGGDALAATAFRFRLSYLPLFMDISRSPIHLFLQSLILGMVMIGILASPILFRLRTIAFQKKQSNTKEHQKPGDFYSSLMRSYSQVDIFWSTIFFVVAAALVLLIISPWMRLFLRQDPFWWTFSFLSEGWRVALCLYWALAIALSVTVLSVLNTAASSRSDATSSQLSQNGHSHHQSDHENGAANGATNGKARVNGEYLVTKQPRVPLIIVRKYFHLLAVAMFAPGLLIDPYLLQLAFGVALSALILVEYLRLCRVFPVGHILQAFMGSFLDHRDSGPIILSHLYLLVGCALPIWFTGVPATSFFSAFSGILTIGIGDTMASICGIRFGRTKWPQTNKTFEGTVAGIVSAIVVAWVLSMWCPLNLQFSSVQWLLFVLALALAGLMEALTQQIDNFIVPLYLLASVILL